MKRLEHKFCEVCGAIVIGKKRADRNAYYYPKRCIACHGFKHRSAEKHPKWTGGRHTTKDGYVSVHVSASNVRGEKSGRLLEHRLVIENHSGRKLGAEEIVHHLNGIRDDNRLENLEIIKRSADGRTNHETDVC